MKSDSTVIVSSITGIGSTILVTPMLRTLRAARPELRIVLLVRFAASRDLLAAGGIADEILVCDYKTLPTVRARLEFLRKLRAMRPFAFINTFPGNRKDKHLLAWLTGAPLRIGHRYELGYGNNLGFLINRPTPISEASHDVEQNLSLLKHLGIDVPADLQFPDLWIPDSVQAEARTRLDSLGDGPFVGMHPGSSVEQGMHFKRWDISRFAELAAILARDIGARFLIFGGPEEMQLKQTLADRIGPTSIVVSEQITMTAALIGQMHGFVTSDSGLMHVAAACGVPTVGVFGPTDPRRTAPRGRHTSLVRADLECSPCWRLETLGRRFHCVRGSPECMAAVTPGEVAERMLALIERRRQS